jgi:rod shape determining protein RodA
MSKWVFLFAVASLTGLGLLTLHSVAPSLARQQSWYLMLGAAAFWSVAQRPLAQWVRASWIGYAGLVVLLLIPLLLGTTNRGIAGWIDLWFFSVQPSQLAIPLTAVALVAWLERYSLQTISGVCGALAIIGVPLILIMLEPDLGTAVVYLAATGALLWSANLRWRDIALLGALGIVAAIIGWLFVLKQFQKDRVTSFMSPDASLSAAGYNARQSLIAVGSGGWWGRGLGHGIQSHLRFLPERQTDFIFASLSEELGFFGSLAILLGYACLGYCCLYLAWRSPSQAVTLYAITILSMTLVQSGINIGMNIGLVPITGITLPLVSYGGSSLVSVLAAYGVIWGELGRLPKKKGLHVG